MKYLETKVGLLWTAWTRANVEVWLSWLEVVLNLDENGALP